MRTPAVNLGVDLALIVKLAPESNLAKMIERYRIESWVASRNEQNKKQKQNKKKDWKKSKNCSNHDVWLCVCY